MVWVSLLNPNGSFGSFKIILLVAKFLFNFGLEDFEGPTNTFSELLVSRENDLECYHCPQLLSIIYQVTFCSHSVSHEDSFLIY